MSDLELNCPHCQQPLEAPEEMLGETVECPSCQGSFQLPNPTPAPPPQRPKPMPPHPKKKATQQQRPAPPRSSLQSNTTTPTRPCPYCGEHVLRSAKKCKHCGEFLDAGMRMQSQQKQSRNMVKPLLIAIILALVVCSFGYVMISQAKKTETQYLENLISIHDKMDDASMKCIGMASGYSDCWRTAIDTGADFNKYLREKHTIYKLNGSVATIERYKSEIDTLMAQLSEPPDRYRQAHRCLVDLYGIYAQLHACGESPSGSLMSYTHKLNDLQGELDNHINRLKACLPQHK